METRGGLLIGGLVVPVPGVHIHNALMPHDASWARLDPGDYHRRPTKWVRAVVPHTTKGIWPQYIIPGAGKGGRDKDVAGFWRKSEDHSAAQIVVDNDGTAACLADLQFHAAYHATTANDWTVGIEIYQEADGGITEAALATFVLITLAVLDHFDIPRQLHFAPYRPGQIVERLKLGGPDVVGVYGHRDQAWKFPWQLTPAQRKQHPIGYAARGRGDPGDIPMLELSKAPGVECFDLSKGEDLAAWKRRQAALNAMGERLTVDGIAGPGTMAAMQRRGFKSGRELDAAVEAVVA